MRQFLFLFLIFMFARLEAQNHWSHYSTKNGLVENEMSCIFIQDKNHVWLGTVAGISVVDAELGTVRNTYTVTNGSLISQNVKEITYANNRIWASTSNGISSFQNGNITHYNGASGFPTQDIKGLAVDTAGRLWLASPQGVAYFNDTTFVFDTTVSAYHIAIDDSNRIFIIDKQYSILFNNNGPFYTHRVYDGNTWTQPVVTGLSPSTVAIYKTRLKKTDEGIVLFSRDFDGGYYKISYPFHLDSVLLDYPAYNNRNNIPFSIKDIASNSHGKKWVASNHELGIFSGKNQVLSPHLVEPFYQKYANTSILNERVAVNDSIVVISSGNGVYIANDDIKTFPIEEELSINQIATQLNTYGPLFHDYFNSRSTFEYPKNSNSFGIYAANFYVSSKGKDSLSFKTNMVNAYEVNHLQGPVSNTAGVEGEWIFKISRQDITNHLNNLNNRGYVPSAKIQNWSNYGDSTLGISGGLAPFVDADGDGCYNPLTGDYPFIKGDEAVYWINHTGKLEYHGMLYAFNSATSPLDKVLFLEYTIINRDSILLDSIKVGLQVDFDLGNSTDDYLGCDSLKNIFYVYNGDSFDESRNGNTGYASNPPALGIKFLSDSMMGFISYNTGNLGNGSINTENDAFRFLNSFWKDGLPVTYGNYGRSSGQPVTNYMYTGNPVTLNGWSEVNPGNGSSSHPAGDRKGIANIPYFALKKDQRKTVSVAIGFGERTVSNQVGGNINSMKMILDQAQNVWDTLNTVSTLASTDSCSNITTGVGQEPTVLEVSADFKVFPNPTTGKLSIELNKIKYPSLLQVFTVEGKLIDHYTLSDKLNTIDLSHLKKGFYLLKLDDKTHKLLIADY